MDVQPETLKFALSCVDGVVRKSQFTDQQIVAALPQVEHGTTVEEVCRKLGVTEQPFDRWKPTFAGMRIADLSRQRECLGESSTLLTILGTATTPGQFHT